MNIPLVDLHAQYLTIKPEIDAAIQARIDAETDKVRKEFDAKLKAIQEEMKKQIDSGGK